MKNTENRKFWDRFAGLYDSFMHRDEVIYTEMYRLIRRDVTPDMEVLELATGTGLIALHIADCVKSVEATDFSQEMIAKARRKPCPENVRFSVEDACCLPYSGESFGAVVIANALHIMPRPEAALQSIRRVLKPDGILIAPTFVHAENSREGRLRARLLKLAGFRAFHQWTEREYLAFLKENGFRVERSVVLAGGFPLAYVTARIEK